MHSFESTQTVPLKLTEDGTIRIAGSRVALESVIHHYNLGADPEEIASRFRSLQLADIYGALAYYLNHRGEIDIYLCQQEADGDRVESEVLSQSGYQAARIAFRERTLARWSNR